MKAVSGLRGVVRSHSDKPIGGGLYELWNCLPSLTRASQERAVNGTDWRVEGEWMKNCNCELGCPCDFNARPTHGSRQGLVAMRISSGHFGDVKLDGLMFAATVDFTGALHEGNRKMQPIIE